MGRKARTKTAKPRANAAAAPNAPLRDGILEAGTRLFRRQGFVATTVDEICAEAGATKGAFFHHFASKEALAEACLARWNEQTAAMITGKPMTNLDDPAQRAVAFMDFIIEMFSEPGTLKSCLAGTTVQEVSETHPRLRRAANRCFESIQRGFQSLLDDACSSRRIKRDTDSLATLWVATIQGALVVCKASRDESVLPASLRHVRAYIVSQIESSNPASGRKKNR